MTQTITNALARTQTITSPYFAWVRCDSPWQEPKLTPQVIHDVEHVAYVVRQQNVTHSRQFEIVAKRVLQPDEINLSINELVQRYPAPEFHHAQS